ncbi:MAG: restriction endonuclease subunit S [Chitinophagaceae bacterium]|nr:restriction endonuclease subunit S [Chitinophagaceae bacterium]
MKKWIEENIGSLIVEENKSPIQVQQASGFGIYPFFTSGDSVLQHTDSLIDGENIFLATGGKANVKFYKGKASYSTDTYVINSRKADTKFLYYLLLNRIDFINSNLFTGSGLKHLQKNELRKLRVLIPEDKIEQSKISSVISEADDVIANTESLILKYQRVKTGLIQELLTKGIDSKGNIRKNTTHKFVVKNEIEIPEGWDVKPLGSISQITSGITLGKKHTGSDTIELPYLRVANVQDGYLDLNDMSTIRIPSSLVGKYKLEIGDVLMNEGGDFDKLGRGTLWRGQLPICLHQNHVFKVRTNRLKLHPEYLEIISQSPYGRKFFILSSKQSTNLASINSSQLKAFPIPLPEPDEQLRILSIHKSIHDKLSSLSESLRKLQFLKTGLMQDLLSGKVRVTT